MTRRAPWDEPRTPVIVRFAVPAAAVGKGYALMIALDPKRQVKEYDETNNTTFLAAP